MKDLTDITVILDQSVSMTPTRSATIEGFNAFLAGQKEYDKPAILSLVQFAGPNETQKTFTDKPLFEVPDLTYTTYNPKGASTALNDAIAAVIDAKGAQLATLPDWERPNKVMIVIMTDGQENSSRIHPNFSTVREKIEHQTDKYSWRFDFIGANMNKFQIVKDYSIPISNLVNYVPTPAGTRQAFADMSHNTMQFRSQ